MSNKVKTLLALASVIVWCTIINEIIITYYNYNREGFSFTQCLNKGFNKEFCVQTPVSYGGPSVCRGPDGRLGQVLAGWGGKCITPAYSTPYFTPY